MLTFRRRISTLTTKEGRKMLTRGETVLAALSVDGLPERISIRDIHTIFAQLMPYYPEISPYFNFIGGPGGQISVELEGFLFIHRSCGLSSIDPSDFRHIRVDLNIQGTIKSLLISHHDEKEMDILRRFAKDFLAKVVQS